MKITRAAASGTDIYAGPDGLKAWRAITVHASGTDLPCDVELMAELEEGAELANGYVVSEVRCVRRRGGPEVSGESIRAIPVAAVLRAGALKANKLLGPRVKDRAAGPTDENLRAVALIYRMTRLVRDNPTRAVAAVFDLPAPTASRWVQLARRRGFLGAAEPRRAGEKSSRRKG